MGPRKGEGVGEEGAEGGQAQVGNRLEAVAWDKGPEGSEALPERGFPGERQGPFTAGITGEFGVD